MLKKITNKYVCTILYILLYHYIWVNFCFQYFAYLGYSYDENVSYADCVMAYIIALIPVVFYRGVRKVSSFISLVLYILGYIPIILSLKLSSGLESQPVILYQLIMMLAMCSFFLADRGKSSEMKLHNAKIPTSYMLYLSILLLVYLVFAFRGHMQFAGLSDLYDFREENNSIRDSGLNGYFIFWLAKAFFPFLFVIYKDKLVVKIIIFIGYVLLFMMSAQKAILLTPLFLLGFDWLLKWKDKSKVDILVPFLMFIIISSVVLLCFESSDVIIFTIASTYFMRTICICGDLFVAYVKFFATNPYTYYSHISFVNALTGQYPYDDALGVVVYDYESNGNAFFWTTEGIASCGALGLIIISVIFYFFLVLLNRIFENKTTINNAMLLILPSIIAMLNSPFLTYIVSHGVFILMMLVLSCNLKKVNLSNNRLFKV